MDTLAAFTEIEQRTLTTYNLDAYRPDERDCYKFMAMQKPLRNAKEA